MSRLEKLTHFLLIVVCVVSVSLLLEKRFWAERSRSGIGAAALVGKRINIPGAEWRRARLNAVVLMNSKCHFCMESMPFYREISSVRKESHQGISLEAISTEPVEELGQTLARERLEVDGAYTVPGDFPLHNTPTMLIVDATGTVGAFSRAS